MVTIEQQIMCVQREISMRYRVYPNLVTRGKMKQAEAEHEIACMHAVHDTLRSLIQLPPMLFAKDTP